MKVVLDIVRINEGITIDGLQEDLKIKVLSVNGRNPTFPEVEFVENLIREPNVFVMSKAKKAE